MLFHVTMTHTEDNCPAYNREEMPGLVSAFEKLDELAKELDVKAHFLLWGAPEHNAFALIEADNIGSVTRYLNTIPIKQDFKVTPVQHLGDIIEMAKAMIKHNEKH